MEWQGPDGDRSTPRQADFVLHLDGAQGFAHASHCGRVSQPPRQLQAQGHTVSRHTALFVPPEQSVIAGDVDQVGRVDEGDGARH